MSAFQRKLNHTHQRQRLPMAVAYRPERFETPEQAAIAATRAAGCTCDPDITINGIRATVKHDDWCALLRRDRDVN